MVVLWLSVGLCCATVVVLAAVVFVSWLRCVAIDVVVLFLWLYLLCGCCFVLVEVGLWWRLWL